MRRYNPWTVFSIVVAIWALTEIATHHWNPWWGFLAGGNLFLAGHDFGSGRWKL